MQIVYTLFPFVLHSFPAFSGQLPPAAISVYIGGKTLHNCILHRSVSYSLSSIQSAMLFLQIVYLFLHYAASGYICPLLPFLFALTGFLSLGGIYMPEASTNETRAYFGALSVTSYSLQPVFSLTRSRKFAASSLLTTSFTAVNPSVLGFCISKEHG